MTHTAEAQGTLDMHLPRWLTAWALGLGDLDSSPNNDSS